VQTNTRRDAVAASAASDLRSKVLTCAEEVQRIKEYALELENENSSLKQVHFAAHHHAPVASLQIHS
jgi:hypothetical protein